MQYLKLKDQLKRFTLFSLADIRMIDNNFHRRRLNEWQDKDYIKKVVKGYYIFSDLNIDERVLFEIANKIYLPSYVSFETALAYYGLIPESVYGITSVSSRRTYLFKTKMAEFSYRRLKPELFWGYEIIEYDHKRFKIACPEKALLDYFYINSALKTRDDYLSLRINTEPFSEIIDKKKLLGYLNKFKQKSLVKRTMGLLNNKTNYLPEAILERDKERRRLRTPCGTEAMSDAVAAQKRPGPSGNPIFESLRRCSSVMCHSGHRTFGAPCTNLKSGTPNS